MLLKDSSLVSAIGLAELAFAARTVAGVYSRYWEPRHLTISLVYLVLTSWLAAAGVNWLKTLPDRPSPLIALPCAVCCSAY